LLQRDTFSVSNRSILTDELHEIRQQKFVLPLNQSLDVYQMHFLQRLLFIFACNACD